MEKLNIKFFTIFLSLFYIFGITSAFFSLQNVAAIVLFFIFVIGIMFFNFHIKKSIILYLIFLVGIVRVQNINAPDIILSQTDCSKAVLEGYVASSKDIFKEKKRIRFYLKTNKAVLDDKVYDDINSKVLIYLNYQDELKDIKIGDKIEVKGKLTTPKKASNPYQFDYRKYLFNNDCNNILYADILDFNKTGSVKFSYSLIKDFDTNYLFVMQKFEKLRNKILIKHAKYIKSPRLEILGGIVFGNEIINPDERIKENFKNSGLLHLLAASGLNVALIFVIWWWLASLVCFPYKLTILFGALFVILYTFMTGFPPSILRAGVMLLFVLFGKLIDRNVNSSALVFFAAFLILLFNPKMIFDIGFQLSFMVTFGLVSVVGVVVEKLKNVEKNHLEKYKNEFELKKQLFYLFSPVNIACVILVPFTAQIWVIPLQMHYFNNIAPYSILANIAVVPFIGILSFLGFISSIFALIPKISDIVVQIFDIFLNPLLALLIKISEFFSSFKYSLIEVMSLNVFQMFLFWGMILLLTLNLKNNFKNKKEILIALFAAFVFLLSFIQIKPDNLEIMMFDVENADCFLIKTPKNKYIMIDTGKKVYRGLTSYDSIIKKYFLNERIKMLDVLILTHYDLDHAGGAIDILKNHKVKLVIIKDEKLKSDTEREIIQYLKENKINYKFAKNNETVYFEPDLKLKTFVPFCLNNSGNETSIVTLLNYKDKKALFMADVGFEGFNSIKKYFVDKTDILKIGHHGAKNSISDDMIKRLKPSYALISAGSKRYNHPNRKTLDILNKNKIKAIVTKISGFTKIIIDKNSLINVYHYNSDTKKLELLEFQLENEHQAIQKEYIENFVKNNL